MVAHITGSQIWSLSHFYLIQCPLFCKHCPGLSGWMERKQHYLQSHTTEVLEKQTSSSKEDHVRYSMTILLFTYSCFRRPFVEKRKDKISCKRRYLLAASALPLVALDYLFKRPLISQTLMEDGSQDFSDTVCVEICFYYSWVSEVRELRTQLPIWLECFDSGLPHPILIWKKILVTSAK